MMRTESEYLVDLQKGMGSELGEAYSALWNEVVHVHEKWAMYQSFFGKSESRVELLNLASAGFSRSLQRLLFHDVIMHLARLSDRAHSGGFDRANLSIAKIIDLLPVSPFQEGLETHWKDHAVKFEFCRSWRDKRLAHTDYKSRLAPRARPLPSIKLAEIGLCLNLIAEVMNKISAQFDQSPTCYDITEGADDAEQLLHVLSDGLLLEEVRQECIANHEVVPQKYRGRPID